MEKEGRARFLTVAEAARLLRVNEKTVRRWLNEETIPGVKVAKHWLIPLAWIDSLGEVEE